MTPSELGLLFETVQLENVLGDGKTFPDCTPRGLPEDIAKRYLIEKDRPGFDLKQFVLQHFVLPEAASAEYVSDPSRSIEDHINALWNVLLRKPDARSAGSLLPLPYPYVVPGGRFREVYYWDSYFTMLGLRESGRVDLIENMVDNFAYLINTIGYIPNGNRRYYEGRSQPPFFSLMVKLLSEVMSAQKKDLTVLKKYLPSLEKEYAFWMKGADRFNDGTAAHRVVKMPDGALLNRYWDENDTPRAEAYKEDVELAHQSQQAPEVLFRHLRAAAESGWDFSSRWFKDGKSFHTLHTTEIIPVDLNCLLYFEEKLLAEIYTQTGNSPEAMRLQAASDRRRKAIVQYCWSDEQKFFVDYDFVAKRQKESLTLAGVFPLFFKIADEAQAREVEAKLRTDFLKPGGLTTTLVFSGQQWDAPNGWAPLQWMAYKGLLNYQHIDTAQQIKDRWMNAVEKVYQKTGKLTEKYDVWNDHAEASGGEYPNQDGFGWTNGVYLAMKHSRTA